MDYNLSERRPFMKEKILYFTDEIHEEFSGISRKPFAVDGNYKYERGSIWNACSFILYNIIMKPIAFLYMKLRFHFKIINKKMLKQCRRSGYFLYANHTNVPADGFMPSLICFPKRVYVLVNSLNLSVWGTRNFMAMIGAIPIPTQYSGMRNFRRKLHNTILNGNVIMIYPEAHIWPYYTKIRPFPSVSFTYPVLEKKPVFTFTVTYQKGKWRTHIKAYVDGPFYPEDTLSMKESVESLRSKAYEAMNMRSKYSTYEKIKYVRKEN